MGTDKQRENYKEPVRGYWRTQQVIFTASKTRASVAGVLEKKQVLVAEEVPAHISQEGPILSATHLVQSCHFRARSLMWSLIPLPFLLPLPLRHGVEAREPSRLPCG